MSKSKYIWLLDPGHGGVIDDVYQTPGKRSPVWPDGRQLFEGEFNRAIVKRLCEMCEKEGIRYKNIVPEDEDIGLTARASRANMIYREDKDCIYISVHANAGGGTGFEVFTSPGQTDSDKVATVIFNKFKARFPALKDRPGLGDGDVDKEAKFTVLVETAMPAVLVECAFMDTLDPDCELLFSEDGRDRFAGAIFEAIKEIEKNGVD